MYKFTATMTLEDAIPVVDEEGVTIGELYELGVPTNRPVLDQLVNHIAEAFVATLERPSAQEVSGARCTRPFCKRL